MKMRKFFDSEDVISWSNSENAKKYVEQQGYFGNSLQELITNVNNNTTSILWNVFSADEVHCVFEDEHSIRSGLFLPINKVKEVKEEKKWRAFRSFKEFSENLNKGVGSEITYRDKDYPLRIITTTIISFIEEANREDQLQIGGGALKFSTWFKEIEIFNGKDWQPFGVEEK